MKLCKKHPDTPYTTRRCPVCMSIYNAKNSAYRAAWRKANADKIKADSAEYRKNNPEAIKAAYAAWYQSNKTTGKARRSVYNAEKCAAYRAKNKAKIKLYSASWNKANAEKAKARKSSYYTANKVKVSAQAAAWRKDNAANLNAKEGRRRAMKLQATPQWANDFFIKEAYHLAKLRSRVLGFKWQVDHIVPLKSAIVCGLHCEANLQVIPQIANLSKGNREWPNMPRCKASCG